MAPGLLLVATLLVAVADLADGKAAQMGGCHDEASGLVHCNAWNSAMCPADRTWMSSTASLADKNKPCTCATMDTGYCYSNITHVATCTSFQNQCPNRETWGGAESVRSDGSNLCGTKDKTGARWTESGGCVRRMSRGVLVPTQYGYCYSTSVNKATCALHAGHCQGDEKHYASRTIEPTFDCPCHKVKVGACKRADGNIRCVVDADSCVSDEEYKAPRSDEAADCTLCDEEPATTTPPPSAPTYTHEVQMSVKLPYSKADFDTAKQNTFKEAVVEAASGSVANTDVTLSNIVDAVVSSRRAGSVNFDVSVKTTSKALADTIASALTEEKLNKILTAKGLEKSTIISAASVTEISSSASSSCLVSTSFATLVSLLTFSAI